MQRCCKRRLPACTISGAGFEFLILMIVSSIVVALLDDLANIRFTTKREIISQEYFNEAAATETMPPLESPNNCVFIRHYIIISIV